jgi:hypothetical protein
LPDLSRRLGVPARFRLALLVGLLVSTAMLAVAGTASAESLVFTKNDPSVGPEVWRADANGSYSVRLSTGTGNSPVLSPDGHQVAYVSGSLYVSNIDGTNRRVVAAGQGGDTGTWWERPSWSPDGTKLFVDKHVVDWNAQGTALVDSWSIWRVGVDGTSPTQVVGWNRPDGHPDQRDPMLSQDGTKLTFTSSVTPSGASTNAYTVWVADADGSNPHQVSPTPTVAPTVHTDQTPSYPDTYEPAFSPNGAEITYSGAVYQPSPMGWYTTDLFTIPAAGGSPVQDTFTASVNESTPAYSSAGAIAYAADGTDAGIYTLNGAGGGSTLIAGALTAPRYGTTAPIIDGSASSTTMNALLQRYTPVLRFDTQELYFADSAAMMTDNFVNTGNKKTTYTNSLVAGSDGTTLAKAINTGATKLSLTYLVSRFSGLAYPGWPTRFPGDNDHLQENQATVQTDAQRMDALTQYQNHAYGHAIYDAQTGRWWLQYWFFYYYNQTGNIAGIDLHQGDWEMVQLRLDSNAYPDQTTYAQHNEAEACPWSAIGKTTSATGDESPIVYVANGSHASYYAAGDSAVAGGNSIDDHFGQGRTEVPSIEQIDTNTPSWVGWPGIWGGTGGTSPRGPQWGDHAAEWSDPQSLENTAFICQLPYPQARRKYGTGVRDRGLIVRPQAGPPAPKVTAHRVGARVRVRFAFRGTLPRGDRRPRSILLTVHPVGRKIGPTGGYYRVRGRSGTAFLPVPVGNGPYRLIASSYGRKGIRSRLVYVRVRQG